MPRRFSSGSRSTVPPVSACTSADLPWSICPARQITNCERVRTDDVSIRRGSAHGLFTHVSWHANRAVSLRGFRRSTATGISAEWNQLTRCDDDRPDPTDSIGQAGRLRRQAAARLFAVAAWDRCRRSPIRTCWSAAPRPTMRPSTNCRTTWRWCSRPIFSRRSSIARTTSAPSRPRTR